MLVSIFFPALAANASTWHWCGHRVIRNNWEWYEDPVSSSGTTFLRYLADSQWRWRTPRLQELVRPGASETEINKIRSLENFVREENR